jgi:hypothetical protein
MSNKVQVVAHPTTGLVITAGTKNPEWGTIRVDSVHKSMAGGILNIQKRTAFIRGKLEDLASLGWGANQSIVGQIIKKESFTPFYENQPAKINPTTKEEVLTNGQKTYLEYVFDETNTLTDTWVGENSAQLTARMQKEIEEQVN